MAVTSATTGSDHEDEATSPVLLVGTRKGVFVMSADADRSTWTFGPPMFLGHVAQPVMLDPRDRRRMLLAVRTGHLGPTVFRSDDLGATWEPVDGWVDHPMWETWAEWPEENTPTARCSTP